MKKFEVVWELPKYDTETQSEKCCWKNGTDVLAHCRIATNLELK